ncbi:hypothetical protein KJ632_02440 [Patescibacteria group bacterium]|nr:hypothetical protein [Patescibacteria group bacterium]
MRLKYTPTSSQDQLRHNRANISHSSCCTIEKYGYGYGKWFEIPGTIDNIRTKIYVVLGEDSEASLAEHAALAAQRGFECLDIPAGGFVFEDSTGFYVYGSSGAYGSGSIDATGIIKKHFSENGESKRVIRGRPLGDF